MDSFKHQFYYQQASRCISLSAFGAVSVQWGMPLGWGSFAGLNRLLPWPLQVKRSNQVAPFCFSCWLEQKPKATEISKEQPPLVATMSWQLLLQLLWFWFAVFSAAYFAFGWRLGEKKTNKISSNQRGRNKYAPAAAINR